MQTFPLLWCDYQWGEAEGIPLVPSIRQCANARPVFVQLNHRRRSEAEATKDYRTWARKEVWALCFLLLQTKDTWRGHEELPWTECMPGSLLGHSGHIPEPTSDHSEDALHSSGTTQNLTRSQTTEDNTVHWQWYGCTWALGGTYHIPDRRICIVRDVFGEGYAQELSAILPHQRAISELLELLSCQMGHWPIWAKVF